MLYNYNFQPGTAGHKNLHSKGLHGGRKGSPLKEESLNLLSYT